METFKVDDYNKAFFEEMKHLGCSLDVEGREFAIPDNKKPNFSEVKNFYFGEAKNLTPFQKKFKTYLESNLPYDIIIKKTDKGMFLVDENDLIDKKDLISLLGKIGAKVTRTMNKKRHLLNTEGCVGKLK